MAVLPRPVTMIMFWIPEWIASSTPYWISGLSTTFNISFGWALVAGRNRVPSPAAGNTALRTLRTGTAGCDGICDVGVVIVESLLGWSEFSFRPFFRETRGHEGQ